MMCWMLFVVVAMTLSMTWTTPLVAWWSAFNSLAQFTVTICRGKEPRGVTGTKTRRWSSLCWFSISNAASAVILNQQEQKSGFLKKPPKEWECSIKNVWNIPCLKNLENNQCFCLPCIIKTRKTHKNQYLGKDTAMWATSLQQHRWNYLLRNILFKLLLNMYPKSIVVSLSITESWRSKDSVGGARQQKSKPALGRFNTKVLPHWDSGESG